MSALTPLLHAGGGGGLAFDTGGPSVLGPTRSGVDVGPGAGHFQDSKMNPTHMQQKMMMHRQAALDRQRAAARNRLGASVVAQANPLCQPVKTLKIPEWGCPPVQEGSSPAARAPANNGDAGAAEALKKEESPGQVMPLSSRSQGRAGGGSKQLEDASDCLAIEEIFDECIQAGPGIVVSAAAEERPQLVRDRHGGGNKEPPRPPAPTPGSLPKITSPRGGDASEAWGGAGGLERAGQNRFAMLVEEDVMDISPYGSDRQEAPPPRGGRRRPQPKAEGEEVQSFNAGSSKVQSWDLDVERAPEPVAPLDPEMTNGGADGRRGRRWWKPWNGPNKGGQDPEEARPGSRRTAGAQPASTEVTAIRKMSIDFGDDD